jgi:hypothetical protein
MVKCTLPGDWIFMRVSTIIVDPGDDELLFLRLQELTCASREVDDDEPSSQANTGSDGSLDDEDP